MKPCADPSCLSPLQNKSLTLQAEEQQTLLTLLALGRTILAVSREQKKLCSLGEKARIFVEPRTTACVWVQEHEEGHTFKIQGQSACLRLALSQNDRLPPLASLPQANNIEQWVTVE